MKTFIQRSPEEHVDAVTGEVYENTFVGVLKKKNRSGWLFMQMPVNFNEVMIDNAQALGIQGIKVFHALLDKLELNNQILISQKEIAERVGMHKTHVSTAIKKLCEMGFIRKGAKHGTSQSYMLHPKLGWKGYENERISATTRAFKDGWTIELKVINGGKPD